MSRAFKPFTHQVQWRKGRYWAPGPKFSDEEQATSYAECRAVPDKLDTFRVVPVSAIGEPTVEQCLAIMKLAHLEPAHWRARLIGFIVRLEKPKGRWSEEELQALQDFGQIFPREKLCKLNDRVVRDKLEMADAREQAAEIAKQGADFMVMDQNPEVMKTIQGAFVQAWVFVPKRTEEQLRGREYDIATYISGDPRTAVA